MSPGPLRGPGGSQREPSIEAGASVEVFTDPGSGRARVWRPSVDDLTIEVDQLDHVAGFKVSFDAVRSEVAESSALEDAWFVGQPLRDAHGGEDGTIRRSCTRG